MCRKAISTKILNFTSDKSKMNFPIINNGGGLLYWTLSANEKWIYFDKVKGSTKKKSFPIVTIKRSGLKTGKYSGEIFIKSKLSFRDNLSRSNEKIKSKLKIIKSAKNIEVLPISSLMGEAIKRISNSTSVSDLFK